MSDIDEQILTIREATLAGDLTELEFVREFEKVIDSKVKEASGKCATEGCDNNTTYCERCRHLWQT